MYVKGNLYFADWRDRKGVRRRKSFPTESAARAYEDAQKAAVRPKQQGAAHQSTKRPAPSSLRGARAKGVSGRTIITRRTP